MEWRAHVAEDYPALATDALRVVLYRRLGEGRCEQIIGFDDHGRRRVTTFDAMVDGPLRGLLIPIEALEALAEALKPGPSAGETKRLEEALEVERRRVDDVLSTLAPPGRLDAPGRATAPPRPAPRCGSRPGASTPGPARTPPGPRRRGPAPGRPA
jgi:hypothetical protein